MNDQLKESMSAVIDGQADDMEVRRVLKALETASDHEASQILAQWERFQTMGSALRGEQTELMAAPGFAASVSEALANESAALTNETLGGAAETASINSSEAAFTPAAVAVKPEPIWRRFAVAATVAFAVIVGVQQYGSFSGDPAVEQGLVADNNAATNSATNNATASQGSAVQTLLASAEGASDESSLSATTQLETAEAQQRLNEYILQHTSHAAQQGGQGMIPFARLANFEEE